MKYKYKIWIQGSGCEAVHGTITQEQAHFWEKNFSNKADDGVYAEDYLHSSIYSFADELEESMLIPQKYLLGYWHDLDNIVHLCSPHFESAVLYVEQIDEDGNVIEEKNYDLETSVPYAKLLGVGFSNPDNYTFTEKDPVHILSYSVEKGGYDIVPNDEHYTDKDNNVLLDEPFDISKLEVTNYDYDGDLFVWCLSYDNIELDIELNSTTGKSSGTKLVESTICDGDIAVDILDDETKQKVMDLLDGKEVEDLPLDKKLQNLENEVIDDLEKLSA